MFRQLLFVLLLSILALAAPGKLKKVELDASSEVFEWEWDLRNFYLPHTQKWIESTEFSFQGSKYFIRIKKKEGMIKYSCLLYSVETSSKTDRIHFRFDLVKRLDNNIIIAHQAQREKKNLYGGWGKFDWIDPATIQDHILKVRMWTSEYDFEYDLENIDLAKQSMDSTQFSFLETQFLIRFQKMDSTNYGCFLQSLIPSSKPVGIHFRFDLVNRMDNTITTVYQGRRELKELHESWGKKDWIDPATIQDHILKVKMWTSEYEFEYDLENIDFTDSSVSLSFFMYGETELRVFLKKNEGGEKYGCYLDDVDSTISSRAYFQVDLFKRLDNRLAKSEKFEFNPNTDVEQGLEDFFEVDTIRDHVLKIKVLFIKPFSDFVEKSVSFEAIGFLLFKKTSSNLSFKVGDDLVYAIHDILSSRCEYFRIMLSGQYFKEAQVPVSLDSKIPIHGIDVDVFKMIIEWIYTMDIKSLNDPISSTLLVDLQNLYVAADMYGLSTLCDSIGKYLNYLLTFRNFGDIFKVAKWIGSESVEKEVLRSWISKSDSFNSNHDQIMALIGDFDGVEDEVTKDASEEQDGEEKELSDTAIVETCRKLIDASSWGGESESKLSVIKCLASLLSPVTGKKTRKIDLDR
jgi:hypothetical protein